MIFHVSLGAAAFARSRALKGLIAEGRVRLAGNRRLKIYGLLGCSSGRQMKVENRVFFAGEQEALALGYRPCGRCMPGAYRRWRKKGR